MKQFFETPGDEAYSECLGAQARLDWLQQIDPNQSALSQLALRKRAWEKRYRPLKGGSIPFADEWLAFWQYLVYCALDPSWGNARKGKKLIQKQAKEAQSGGFFPVLKEEYYNLLLLYIQLCLKDKQYRSVFFGLGKKKPQNLRKKIKNEFLAVQMQFLNSPADDVFSAQRKPLAEACEVILERFDQWVPEVEQGSQTPLYR